MSHLIIRMFVSNLLVLLTLGVFGQTTNSAREVSKKQQRADKKMEKEALEEAQWKQYQDLASKKIFVVEFTRVGGNNLLPSRLNFIYVHNDSVTFQVPAYGLYSTNGLGGFTVKGTVSNYKYTPPANSKKPIFIEFEIKPENRTGIHYVNVTVYGDGTASVNMDVDFSGNFMAPSESNALTGVDMRY